MHTLLDYSDNPCARTLPLESAGCQDKRKKGERRLPHSPLLHFLKAKN